MNLGTPEENIRLDIARSLNPIWEKVIELKLDLSWAQIKL